MTTLMVLAFSTGTIIGLLVGSIGATIEGMKDNNVMAPETHCDRYKIRKVLDRALSMSCAEQSCPHCRDCINGAGNCSLFALQDIADIISGKDEKNEI